MVIVPDSDLNLTRLVVPEEISGRGHGRFLVGGALAIARASGCVAANAWDMSGLLRHLGWPPTDCIGLMGRRIALDPAGPVPVRIRLEKTVRSE